MKCYKCNSVLTDSDYCMKCGADVSVYKNVVKASNTYYNLGLEKAKVRDMSGAILALKTSLDLNKNNIKARNLLGLVYCEIGEIAQALSEWVISINLKRERNVAEVYINKINASPNRLEAINQSIKKYNLALEKAKEGGDDVAIIQLKRVVASSPNYVKAHLLLALLYMKKGEDDRAVKILHRVLKTDRNNTLALKYLKELGDTGDDSSKDNGEEYYKNRKRKTLSGNDVILPRTSYREPKSGVYTVVYILLGVLIGAAVFWFLVLPGKLQTAQHDNNTKINEYNQKLSSYTTELSLMQSEKEELENRLDLLNKELDSYKGDTGQAAMYAGLIKAVGYYMDNDFDNAALALADIDVSQLPTDAAKELYTKIEEESNKGAKTFYTAGVNSYNEENYAEAITYLNRAFKLDDTTVETPYYLAMSYIGINDKENAQKYIDIIHKKYADTTFAKQLDEYLSSINFTEE